MSEGGAPARFSSPGTMPRPYGYSQVVEITGGHPVYISGQVPLDTDNQVVGVGDFAAQARQAFENVRLALEAVGLTFAHVVKIHMCSTFLGSPTIVRFHSEGRLVPPNTPEFAPLVDGFPPRQDRPPL
ncbi:MAG: endoribonuclease [Thermomicrobiales bacterium]|nr:endoribonuclease [Thermomicrobiales bacterium]